MDTTMPRVNFKQMFGAFAVIAFGFFIMGAQAAKADSLNLSIPIPYFETINSPSIAPQPDISFEIDLTSGLSQATAGNLAVNSIDACSNPGDCYFTDSNGNSLGSSVNLASIPSSAVYYYKITKGGSATGLQELDFTLTPTACGGNCPGSAEAVGKIKVLSQASGGESTNLLAVYAESTGTGPSIYVPIFNLGNAALNWTATPSQNWCHVSASSGSINAFDNGGIKVTFDSPAGAGLAAGAYTCLINWSDQSGASWVYPTGGTQITYTITDSNTYQAWGDVNTCEAINLHWNNFSSGIPGVYGPYDIYRTNDSANGYSFASATKIKSNYPALDYTDSAINLVDPTNLNNNNYTYAYYILPAGTTANPVRVAFKPNPINSSLFVAERCGGAMMPRIGSSSNTSGSTNGMGTYINGSAYIYNLGNAPMTWRANGSDQTCVMHGDFSSAGNLSNGTIPPGGQTAVYFNSDVGYNRTGHYACSYSFSGNGTPPYNTDSASLSMDLAAALTAPASITTDTSACGLVALHWAPATDATGYKIIRTQAAPGGGDLLVIYATNSNGATQLGSASAMPYPQNDSYTFVDTTAVPGTAYDYGIETTNGFAYGNGSLAFSEAPANIAAGSTPGACQQPAAVCPSGTVQLSAATIPLNGTATVTPPTGFTGTNPPANFNSSNNTVASVSWSANNAAAIGNSAGTSDISGNSWNVPLVQDYYNEVAVSNSGQYQTVVARGSYIYVSSDHGNTWLPKDSIRNWYGLAMSSSGQYQTALDDPLSGGGHIYISSDYGQTWTAKESLRNWIAVAISDDGKNQTAAVSNGTLYRSSDFGNTWTPVESTRFWSSLAMSSTGQYQTAGVQTGGNLYVSSDYGQTWTPKGPGANWDEKDIAVSDSGQYQTAAVYGGQIYISSDYGQNWAPEGLTKDWYGIVISGSGQYQAAGAETAGTYVSSDYGQTWTLKNTISNQRSSGAVAMSNNGQYLTATGYGDYIYISYDYGQTWSRAAGSTNCSLDPVTLTVSGSPAGPSSVTLDNQSTCGQMVVNWTGVAGATSYSVVRSLAPNGSPMTIASGLTSTTYTDSAPPSDTATPYNYSVFATTPSGQTTPTAASNNPSSINACAGNITDSDLNIVAVNGSQLYKNPSLPNGSQCDSSTDPLPANINLKIGDVLKFSLDLCNDQGNGTINMESVSSPFINLIMPSNVTDFSASYNSTPLVYDGVQASNYSPANGHYFVYGSAPNQTIVFNLGGNSINKGEIATVTYSAQLSVPKGFVGALSRFQDSFNPVYREGAGPVRFTPLIPFIVAPNNAPQIKEAN